MIPLLCACQSAPPENVPPAETAADPPSFYCERSHTNHAWSYTHRGIYVDGKGFVFRFRHSSRDQPLLRVHADSLTEERLLARYAPGRTPAGTPVPAAEMARRYRQALESRDGELSEPRNRGADMGATISRCYLPGNVGIYREVVLRQSGDEEFENRSPAARELSAWLDSLALHAR
ncbi:MAG TPA: hypothetical protein VHG93_23805 [Longimicrobium sp.]|nr:hypothetical protein [Longimicrobium sp.]